MRWQLEIPQATFREIAGELFDPWKRYTTSVSSAGMAMSPHTAVYLMYLCRTTKPKAVCDLGSGFSSYVLRTYANESGCDVTSVEDDQQWAAKTVEYLSVEGLDGTVEDYADLDTTPRFDVVLHDLAGGERRNEAMATAVQICEPRGFVIFDDAHDASHYQSIVATCKRFEMYSWSLKPWTLDKSGRFAMLARKP